MTSLPTFNRSINAELGVIEIGVQLGVDDHLPVPLVEYWLHADGSIDEAMTYGRLID